MSSDPDNIQVQDAELAERMIMAMERVAIGLEELNENLTNKETGLLPTLNDLIVSLDENSKAILEEE